MWVKAEALVLVVEPSPKSQNRLVMVPLEESVNVTVKGLKPLVGEAVNAAEGTIAPIPISELVLLPPLLVVTTTTLLKAPGLRGAKLTTRLVAPKPGRSKGVPERIANGPLSTVTMPLLSGAPPRFVTVKLAWTLEPTR